MLTLDANVWISAYDPHDRFNADSTRFLRVVTSRALILNAPALLLVEVACAIARRAGDAGAGDAAYDRLVRYPGLVVHPLSEYLVGVAARLGSRQLLRGADALYAATAALVNAPLVSWDDELVQRAGAVAPSVWLERNR
jgi:predicted nucleic acid-binding protein